MFCAIPRCAEQDSTLRRKCPARPFAAIHRSRAGVPDSQPGRPMRRTPSEASVPELDGEAATARQDLNEMGRTQKSLLFAWTYGVHKSFRKTLCRSKDQHSVLRLVS